MKFDSIKFRLLLITLICIVGMGFLVGSQHYFNQKHIALNQDRDSLLRLSRELLQLRRHEKDFLLRGQMRYINRFNERITLFNEQLTDLKPMFLEYALDDEQTSELAGTMLQYQTLFGEVVSIQRQIGLTESGGLRAQFDSVVSTLKALTDNKEAAALLLQAQLAQRDLLMNYDNRYSEGFNEAINGLSRDYAQTPAIVDELDKLQLTFGELSALISRMGETESEGLRGEFRRQAHLMESQLASIDEKTQPVIAEQANRMRLYNFLIAVLTCAVLIMVLIKSFSTFHRAFSYFVMFFYQCKRQYQRIDPKQLGYAEFKSLAELANEMVEARKEAEIQLADAQRQLKEQKEK